MSRQSHENWHDSQVETIAIQHEVKADKIVDTLQDKNIVNPIDGAMVLMAVRAAERYDQIGKVNGISDKHRNMADQLIRSCNVRFEQ